MKYDFPIVLTVALIRMWQKLSLCWYKLRSPILAYLCGVRCGAGVLFQGRTIIRAHHLGEIEFGRNVVFNSQPSTNLVGLVGPTVIDTLGGGRIRIGEYSGFSSVVLSSRSEIRIGSRVKVGGNSRIFDHDFHSINAEFRSTPLDRNNVMTRPIVIEDDVFIGTNAIILKGSRIGARSIVAAGSVVFGLDVPSDSMVKGNPAVIVGRRTK